MNTNEMGKILAVDDTPASLRLLTDILKDEGYEVRSAISGKLALHAAISNPPDLVLLDIRMPEMDGFEVCRRLKADPATCDVPVIFVSAASEVSEKLQGFEFGAVDYVTKPYQREELLARVRTHLELNRLRNKLEEAVEERTIALKASERKLRESLFGSITALAAIVELRDPYTAGHQHRVARLAVGIGKVLQMSEDRLEGLYLAGVVHDVGKIQVPAEILSMPRRLTEIEFNLIRQHPQSGYDILKTIDFPWQIAQMVLQHHERLDGSGYPHGISGDQIMLEARILSVADVVEAMSSHRPYRPGLGIDAALDEIVKWRGKQYDPEVVDACVKLFKEQNYVISQ
ncbi:MAG: response regulator [Gallionella sp.]|nr:response regulator [Gallionella sp.]